MENFFGILKSECFNIAKPVTHQEACDLIHDYIHFYNNPQTLFKNKTDTA